MYEHCTVARDLRAYRPGMHAAHWPGMHTAGMPQAVVELQDQMEGIEEGIKSHGAHSTPGTQLLTQIRAGYCYWAGLRLCSRSSLTRCWRFHSLAW